MERRMLIAATALLATASCGKSAESQLHGQWRGRVEFTAEQKPFVNQQQADEAAQLIVLHLKDRNRYRLLRVNFVVDGRWELVAGILTLTPEKVGGKTPEQFRADMLKRIPANVDPRYAMAGWEDVLNPDRLQVSEDRTRLTSIDPEDIQFGTLYFQRDAGTAR